VSAMSRSGARGNGTTAARGNPGSAQSAGEPPCLEGGTAATEVKRTKQGLHPRLQELPQFIVTVYIW
jgi:hypothetical protein